MRLRFPGARERTRPSSGICQRGSGTSGGRISFRASRSPGGAAPRVGHSPAAGSCRTRGSWAGACLCMSAAAGHCMRLPRPHGCLKQECCCRSCPGAIPLDRLAYQTSMNIGLRFVLAFLSRVWKVRQPSAIFRRLPSTGQQRAHGARMMTACAEASVGQGRVAGTGRCHDERVGPAQQPGLCIHV